MKLTADESRALGFIALLIVLSVGARLLDRPEAVGLDALEVDVAALEAASREALRRAGSRRAGRWARVNGSTRTRRYPKS